MPSKNHEYDEIDDDCDRPRAIFYQFKEHDQIIKIIDNFPNLINDLRQKEKSYDYFTCNLIAQIFYNYFVIFILFWYFF